MRGASALVGEADLLVAVGEADVPAVGFWYDDFGQVSDDEVLALIGPSGCGKSTFLRILNRMNDEIPKTKTEGRVTLDGQDIFASSVDPVILRARVGMVFQRPNPFPKSIYDNVIFGPRLQGVRNRAELDANEVNILRGFLTAVQNRRRMAGGPR